MTTDDLLALARAAGLELPAEDAPAVSERLGQLLAFARELDGVVDDAPLAARFDPAWEDPS